MNNFFLGDIHKSVILLNENAPFIEVPIDTNIQLCHVLPSNGLEVVTSVKFRLNIPMHVPKVYR